MNTKLNMNTKKLVFYAFMGFSASFTSLSYASGFTITSCLTSSLTDGGGADSCSYGQQTTGQVTGVGTGDLNIATLNGIDSGGWGTDPALKSDVSGSALTITGTGGSSGTWSISGFNITNFFAPLPVGNNFLLDALFVIKTSTAFEWFVFEPLTGTLLGTPVLLNASGTWSTQDFYHTNGTSGDPGISHLSVYFRQNTSLSTSEVPVPAAVWLFGSGLTGVFCFLRRRMLCN